MEKHPMINLQETLAPSQVGPFPAHATKLERFRGCTCRKCLVKLPKISGEAFSEKKSKPGSPKRWKKTCLLVERYIDHGYLNPKIRWSGLNWTKIIAWHFAFLKILPFWLRLHWILDLNIDLIRLSIMKHGNKWPNKITNELPKMIWCIPKHAKSQPSTVMTQLIRWEFFVTRMIFGCFQYQQSFACNFSPLRRMGWEPPPLK